MAEPKTTRNNRSVAEFLDSVPHAGKRADSWKILELMERVTGEKAEMWGDGIVGFGTYTMRYASGKTGDWPLAAFSPRKQYLTIYIEPGLKEYDRILPRLGTFKTSKVCLYINKLADVDEAALEDLVRASVRHTQASSVR